MVTKYLQLIRFHNCIITGLGVMISALLVDLQNLLIIPILAIPAMLVTGAGNALNDYYDYELDKIIKPKKPIVSGKITLNCAKNIAYGMFFIGLVFVVALAIYVQNFSPVIIVGFAVFLLCIYEWKLKNLGFIGNVSISALTGLVFIYGASYREITIAPITLALIAFFATLAREIIKDIEDFYGDKFFRNTLPTIIGVNNSFILAYSVLGITIILAFLPYMLNIFSYGYLIFTVLASMIFIATLILKKASEKSKYIKIGMVIGILGFVVGIIERWIGVSGSI